MSADPVGFGVALVSTGRLVGLDHRRLADARDHAARLAVILEEPTMVVALVPMEES